MQAYGSSYVICIVCIFSRVHLRTLAFLSAFARPVYFFTTHTHTHTHTRLRVSVCAWFCLQRCISTLQINSTPCFVNTQDTSNTSAQTFKRSSAGGLGQIHRGFDLRNACAGSHFFCLEEVLADCALWHGDSVSSHFISYHIVP